MGKYIRAEEVAEPGEVYAVVWHAHGRHSVRRVVVIDGDVFSVKWETLGDLTLREADRFLGSRTRLERVWREPAGVNLANLLVPL